MTTMKMKARRVLGVWEECTGFFKGLKNGDLEVAVILSSTRGDDLRIVFPANSLTRDILKRELNDELLGRRIGIVRTDDDRYPIRIRNIADQGAKRSG